MGCCQKLQKTDDLPASRVIQSVVRPLAHRPTLNNPRSAENIHVIRQSGLGQLGIRQQFACATLAILEQFQNLHTVRVAERLENTRRLFVPFLHCSASCHIKFY